MRLMIVEVLVGAGAHTGAGTAPLTPNLKSRNSKIYMTQVSDWEQKAAEYLEQEKYTDAIALYKQSIARTPSVMSNYWHLGLALLLEGRESEAENTFTSAIAHGTPDRVEVWKAELIGVLTEAAVQREAEDKFQESLVIRRHIRQLDPQNFNNLLALIWLYIKLDIFGAEGRMALSQATQLLSHVKISEINYNLLVQLLEIFFNQAPLDAFVVTFFEACLTSNGINQSADTVSYIKDKLAWIYSLKGSRHWRKGELDEAELMAYKALAMQPNSPGILLNLTKVLSARDKFEEAASSAEKALEIEPNFSLVRDLLDTIYTKMFEVRWSEGRYAEAGVLAQKALELQPNSAKGHFYLAMALYFQGLFRRNRDKFDEAEKCFKRALEITPAFPEARQHLSTIPYMKQFASKGYCVTADCFTDIMPIWEKYLKHFANLPGVNVLEIGSFEGMASCWLLDNILTHESARITCIDNFEGVWSDKKDDNQTRRTLEYRFDYNIAKTGAAWKVQKIVGLSQEVMRSLPLNSYDIIYVDGSHRASDVLEDVVIAWGLAKVGCSIIFDDYHFTYPDNPAWDTKIGIDAFMTVYSDKIKVIYHGERQVIVEKTA